MSTDELPVRSDPDGNDHDDEANEDKNDGLVMRFRRNSYKEPWVREDMTRSESPSTTAKRKDISSPEEEKVIKTRKKSKKKQKLVFSTHSSDVMTKKTVSPIKSL